MCFFIYTPNQNLLVEYTTEMIQLLPDGSSIVISDMLVSKASDVQEDITQLRIIYPNQFFTCSKKDTRPLHSKKCIFSDISETFIYDSEGINQIQESYGVEVEITRIGAETSLWPQQRRISYEEVQSGDQVDYRGLVKTNCNLEILFFSDLQMNILHDIKYTVLTYNLGQDNLIDNNKRWIRLKFRGINAVNNQSTVKDIIWKKITNSLVFSYQIDSPHDIKDNFLLQLDQYLKRSRKTDGKNFTNAAKELIEFFKKEGIQNNKNKKSKKHSEQKHLQATTLYCKYFLHIDPNDFERLSDISHDRESLVLYVIQGMRFSNDTRETISYHWFSKYNDLSTKSSKEKVIEQSKQTQEITAPKQPQQTQEAAAPKQPEDSASADIESSALKDETALLSDGVRELHFNLTFTSKPFSKLQTSIIALTLSIISLILVLIFTVYPKIAATFENIIPQQKAPICTQSKQIDDSPQIQKN